MIWWTAFEIAINLFQGFLMIFFMKNQLHTRKKSILVDLAFILAIGCYQSLYLFFPIGVSDTVTFILPIIYGCINAEDRWYISLFWGVALAALFIVTISLITDLYMRIPSVSWAMIMQESQLRIAFVVTCNISLLLIIFLTTRLMHPQGPLSWLAMAVFVVLIGIQLLTAELMFAIRISLEQENRLFTYANICLLLSSIISLALFEFLSITTEKRHRAESELRTLQESQHHAAELREMYAAMIEQQHDLKHRIQSVEQMVACGKQLHTQSIVEELKSLDTFGPEFITGCIAVDAMLTAKKATMNKLCVRFDFSPYPLHELPISESDFCLVLDNLLDNAIEAVGKCSVEKREIRLSFARSWDMFYIVCENTMRASSVKMSGLHFISSKGGFIHGYGIQSIRRIVENAQGRCKFIPQNEVFRVEIVLPFIKETMQCSK